jgi:hypothetical protein
MTCKTKQESVAATGIGIDIGKEVFRLGRFGADGRLAPSQFHISCKGFILRRQRGSWDAWADPRPPACKPRTWPAWHEALKHRGALTVWVDPTMRWKAAPTGNRG